MWGDQTPNKDVDQTNSQVKQPPPTLTMTTLFCLLEDESADKYPLPQFPKIVCWADEVEVDEVIDEVNEEVIDEVDKVDDDDGFEKVVRKERKTTEKIGTGCNGTILFLQMDKYGKVQWGKVKRQDTHQDIYFAATDLLIADAKQHQNVHFVVSNNHRGACAKDIVCI